MSASAAASVPPLWQARTGVTPEPIARFCRKWKISELSVFGSVLTKEFRPESDVDVLVAFDPTARWDLYEFVAMRDELAAIFARSVDLVEKKAVRNPFRRHHILNNGQVIYAA
jgi:predicted nucleotidyltransferase